MSDLLPTTIADDGKVSQTKSQNSQNDALQQLNKTGCYIKSVEGKGRGVFGVLFLHLFPPRRHAQAVDFFLYLGSVGCHTSMDDYRNEPRPFFLTRRV